LKKLSEENENNGEGKSEEDSQLNLGNLEFQSFMQEKDISAPVLEKIAGRQPRPIFVGGIHSAPNLIAGEEKESDSFKYVAEKNAGDEPKYIDSDSHIRAIAETANLSTTGKTGFREERNKEAIFIQSPEARVESSAQERVWDVERMDFEREKRKSQHEREETKYDKYKPELPKSR
jgi:hypothetical protein